MPRQRQFTKPATPSSDDAPPLEAKKGLTRAELGLDALSFGGSLADELSTEHMLRNPANYEADPLARPLTRLPEPAYLAAGAGMDYGLARLGHHMHNSDKPWERKIWWLPQAAQIGIQAGLAAHNMELPESHAVLGRIAPPRRPR